jgi:hypothetical protein
MARLNLICNGMILFNQLDDRRVEIVIPTVAGHVRSFCSEDVPTQTNLSPVPVGSYSLAGPTATPGSLRDLIETKHYLVLKQNVVAFDRPQAVATSAIITVPMPPSIRLFRASEPAGDGLGPFGSTDPQVAYAVPRLYHDVVVFCYPDVPAGTTVSIDPLASVVAGETEAINWIFYSTDRSAVTEDSGPHVTSLNDLLTVNGRKTDFSLSAIGFRDGSHSTGVRVKARHMLAFHELPLDDSHPPIDLESGELGCSGAVLG